MTNLLGTSCPHIFLDGGCAGNEKQQNPLTDSFFQPVHIGVLSYDQDWDECSPALKMLPVQRGQTGGVLVQHTNAARKQGEGLR